MSTPEKHNPTMPEHLLDHPTETHIHNPDAERTSLERWLRRNLEGGPAAWGPWLGGGLVVILGIAFMSQGKSTGKPGEEAWSALLTANSAAEFVSIADGANTGEAAAWASQMSANQYYNQALGSLLTSREEVDANLAKAKSAYENAVKRAEGVQDTELANLARLGLGRTLEMQGKLTDAINQYNEVAKAAPETNTGKKAAAFAEALKKPEAQSFYQALAAYKPQPAVDPTLGGGLGLPPNHPSLEGPTIKTPLPALPDPGDMLRDIAPPPSSSGASSPIITPPSGGDDLKDLAPPPATQPVAQPEAKPADLPANPFGEDKPK